MKNILEEQTSNYLRQHATNPIHWQIWGDEAFKLAKELDRPIFLSSGYFSCYWCHVMEHECFEDQEIAKILNENFISIKLDKEEMPVVDEIYMDSLSALGRSGGWPLSIFMDHNLHAFFGGTYFPKLQFAEVLKKIIDYWNNHRDELILVGNRVKSVISITEFAANKSEVNFNEIIKQYEQRFDSVNGGFSKSPKFPPSVQLNFLINAKEYNTNQFIRKTLDNMIIGGLYDHINGGFFRYSVDEKWNIPHFEKMLYDNAQIILNLSKVVNESAIYKTALIESINYLKTQLTDGCFSSSLDAGEPEKEGEYYLFETDQVENQDNIFEGKVHLRFADQESFLSFHNSELYNELTEIRKSKQEPRRDYKIITSWNALAIKALVSSAKIDTKYLALAKDVFTSLVKINYNDNLFRSGKNTAVLEDYAYLISATLDLYQATRELSYLEFAKKLLQKTIAEFWDSELGVFLHAKNASLIIKKFELLCNVNPSPNAVMLENLHILNLLGEEYLDHERQLEDKFMSVLKFAFYLPTYLAYKLRNITVITTSDNNLNKIIAESTKSSNCFYLVDDSYTNLKVCQGQQCNEYSIDKFLETIK